ncbi:MAG TPA: EamA family transporter, partial [Polyangiales bacterium]
MPSDSERRWVALCLLSLYLIWGSTFLGMRFALASFPPFLLGGLRFGLAGGSLYAWQRLRGVARPTARQWLHAVYVGALLFGIGNGFVAFAQRTISSGVAAIVIATVSLWSVLFAMVWGTRPARGELIGLLLGLGGVALLQRGGALGGDPLRLVALLLAPIAWAFGSQWGARLDLPRGAMGSAIQMLGGGLVLLAMGLVSGERMH